MKVSRFFLPLSYFNFVIEEYEIHAFDDASLDTMCAVVYLRAVRLVGLVHNAFVVGKVGVASIRKITAPKSEL